MKNNVVEMKIKKDLAERINALMSIDNFEVQADKLEELGFEIDKCVFSKRIKLPTGDMHFAELSVYAGQTNAWIECNVVYPDNTILDSEPIFDNIEGDYTLEIIRGDKSYEEYTLHVVIED